jgi:superfamily II DNA/RNA helicase
MDEQYTFSQLMLSDELVKYLESIQFTCPTQVQREVIPSIFMGKDIVACAQTGTGKTASFALPMIDLLGNHRARARMPRALILVPTRELASQVSDAFKLFSAQTKLSWATLIGGTSILDQEKKLDRGVDVIIATPGRFLDLVERGKILLSDLRYLVIDEADRMLDMGFIPDIEKILGLLPESRQTLLFSATLPDLVQKLIKKFLLNPKQVNVTPNTTTATTITQYWIKADGEGKLRAILWVLESEKVDIQSVFIFCNRKKDVDLLNSKLKHSGFKSAALHGDMHQVFRTETLQKFRDQEITVMVASDVAARGIDVEFVSHVINYDIPANLEDYVHRIGRTGRAGKSGRAFSLISSDQMKHLKALQVMTGQTLKEVILDDENMSSKRSGNAQSSVKNARKMPQSELSQKSRPTQRNRDLNRENQVSTENVLGFGHEIPSFFKVPHKATG